MEKSPIEDQSKKIKTDRSIELRKIVDKRLAEIKEKKDNEEKNETESEEESDTPFLGHRIATSSDPGYWEEKKAAGMTDKEAEEKWRSLRRTRDRR